MLVGNVIFNTISSLFGWLWTLISTLINNILYYIVEPILAYWFAFALNANVWLLGVVGWLVNAALVGFVAMFDGLAGLFIYGIQQLCIFLHFSPENAMNSINSYMGNLKTSMPTMAYVLQWLFDGTSGTLSTGFLVTFNVLIFVCILKLVMRLIRG